MVYGVNVAGDRAGVVGRCGSEAGPDTDVEGVGTYGSGNAIGVFGKTVSGGDARVAGVYGQDNRGKAGVIGAVMRGGTAVAGINVSSLGNPLATFDSLPNPGSGSGTGVYGTSGSGTGVHGTSRSGFGLHGSSNLGPGGVFESAANAQLRLLPRDMPTPEGRVAGAGGELLATVAGGDCRLWFCTHAGDAASASWDLVAGTRPFPGALIAENETGTQVKRIQMRLNMVFGTDLNGDGEFGPITKAAVSAFQEREGIPQTGTVDALTWDRLFALT